MESRWNMGVVGAVKETKGTWRAHSPPRRRSQGTLHFLHLSWSLWLEFATLACAFLSTHSTRYLPSHTRAASAQPVLESWAGGGQVKGHLSNLPVLYTDKETGAQEGDEILVGNTVLAEDCTSPPQEGCLLPPWLSMSVYSSRGGMHRAVGKRDTCPANQSWWFMGTPVSQWEYPPHPEK